MIADVFSSTRKLKRRPSFSRHSKQTTTFDETLEPVPFDSLISRLRDSEEAILRRQLYEERIERARSGKMTRKAFDGMFDAIELTDADLSCDDIMDGDQLTIESGSDLVNDDQGEGVFVRKDNEWVDLEENQSRKIVFRFKWKW